MGFLVTSVSQRGVLHAPTSSTVLPTTSRGQATVTGPSQLCKAGQLGHEFLGRPQQEVATADSSSSVIQLPLAQWPSANES